MTVILFATIHTRHDSFSCYFNATLLKLKFFQKIAFSLFILSTSFDLFTDYRNAAIEEIWRQAFSFPVSSSQLRNFQQHFVITENQSIFNNWIWETKLQKLNYNALVAWHSGHRVRLQNRISRVQIQPGCKVSRILCIAVLLS
jgi:hypothetical protein